MKLLDAVTSTGPGAALQVNSNNPQLPKRTFQAYVKGSGSLTASVDIQVTNDLNSGQYLTLGTINLSGSGSATDGFVSDAPWMYVRANLTSVSGTNAAVTVAMGV